MCFAVSSAWRRTGCTARRARFPSTSGLIHLPATAIQFVASSTAKAERWARLASGLSDAFGGIDDASGMSANRVDVFIDPMTLFMKPVT